MRPARFDRLYTVRLAHESRNGCAEVCREADGALRIRLRMQSAPLQREVLKGLDASIPVRLENGALEVLLPWHGGISLGQWLYEKKPTLGQRRDACLSLLKQQVELQGKLPPCLTVLAASAENLTVTGSGMFLQYLPDLRRWEPDIGEAQAVCAVAAVICETLSIKPDPWRGRRLPEELLLLALRQKEHGYTSWGQLQRDVAAIPDTLSRGIFPLHPYTRRIRCWLRRYGKYILQVLAALLLTAALFSLISFYRRHEREKGSVWQGMPQVGNQDLRNEEGGE
ncbi:MAG: hypothetical protein HFG08_08100 [Oscillibacter sp.]|nr:hypothetical protein [Oscillibacter sp.]